MSKKEGKCGFCPPHGGPDNPTRKEKPNRHKNIKRDTIRKGAIEKVRKETSPEQD